MQLLKSISANKLVPAKTRDRDRQLGRDTIVQTRSQPTRHQFIDRGSADLMISFGQRDSRITVLEKTAIFSVAVLCVAIIGDSRFANDSLTSAAWRIPFSHRIPR